MLWIAVAASSLSATQPPADSAFERCEALLRESPFEKEPASCVYGVARATDLWPEAANLLEDYLRRRSDDHWLRLYLAHTVKNIPEQQWRTEFLYRDAIEGFEEMSDAEGAALAKKGLVQLLSRQSRYEEVQQLHQEILDFYRSSPELSSRLQARKLIATSLFHQKKDLIHAYRLLKENEWELEQHGFPEELHKPHMDTLVILGALSLELGQPHQARDYFERAAELEAQQPNRLARDAIRYNQMLTSQYFYEQDPSPANRKVIVERTRARLETAQEGAHREAVANLHLELGQLLGLPEGRPHFETCIAMARHDGDSALLSQCLAGFAVALAPEEPEKALRLKDEALQYARRSGEARTLAATHSLAMELSWQILPTEDAIQHSLAALSAIDRLREQQSADEGRLGLFTEWVPEYQRVFGHLLQATQDQEGSGYVDTAFRVSERMRARVLREFLERAAQSDATPVPEHIAERLAEIRSDMSRLNRLNLSRDLTEAQLQDYRRRLEQLEMAEAKLHDELEADRATVVPLETDLQDLSLQDVQTQLLPGEAMLVFQVAPWQDIYGVFGGGSWALLITSKATSIHRFEEARELTSQLEFLLGSIESRDRGFENRLLEVMGSKYITPLLQRLPDQTNHLILVPDGPLHSLPFAGLRVDQGSHASSRYRISRAPSATLWHRWRTRATDVRERWPALVLADPSMSYGNVSPAFESVSRKPPESRSTTLGPLPLAREEGRDITRHLGRGVLFREGNTATEHFLRSLPLQDFRLLHFAAHAKADLERPGRSAIFLAPGAERMDGLLQFREIVDLDLDGRIVVLSACDTATGEILRGEGVLDLARAFFQGGAHAVVASLWPLRDDDGRDFFDAFYRHLAEGESLAGALQGAQVDRIEDGAPAAAWAGIVVLGDGSMVPFPDAKDRLSFVAVVLLALGIWILAVVVAKVASKS